VIVGAKQSLPLQLGFKCFQYSSFNPNFNLLRLTPSVLVG